MFKKLLLLPLITCSLFSAEDLGTVEVKDSKNEMGFSSVFDAPNYEDRSNFVENMPAQKRLTKEEAMFMPGTQGDPMKAISLLGGVTSLGDTTGELYIYGSKPEESLYTINHLPIGYLYHLGGIHSVISPEAIGQIDAYLGGFDVTYGDVMGGVIDISPAYPTSKNSSAYGHVGIYDASAGANVALSDKLSFYLGGRRSYVDLLLGAVGKATGTLDEDNNVTYTQFPQYYDITFMMSYNLDSNNHFSLELISAQDELKIHSEANAVKDPAANGDVNAKFGFTTVGGRWEVFNRNYSANTLVYNLAQNTKTEFYDDYFVNVNSNRFGIFHQSTLEYDKHKVVAGFEYTNFQTPLDINASRPPSEDDPDYDFTTEEKFSVNRTLSGDAYSIFLEDIYSPNYNWSIRFGARFAHSSYQNYGSTIDPRFSILYALNSKSNVSFSTGRYSQYPEGFKTMEEIGNTELASEIAWHYILHYDVEAANNLHLNIEPYYKDFDNLAIDDNTSGYANEGDGYAYGIDTSLKYRDGRYYAFIAYTYLESKRELNTADGELKRFYGDIPHTLQAVGAWRFANNWSLSTLAKYHSGKPYTEIIGTYTDTVVDGRVRPIYGESNAARLPDYFTLNVKIAQQIKFENSALEWSFEIMNLTNHENISDIRYDDDYNEIGYYKQLPLLPWLDITYRF